MVHQMHWWILGCVAVALALRVWRDRQQRREGHGAIDRGALGNGNLRED
jgi:hypothetical protein